MALGTRFEGKVAIVTGASSGIGRATAKLLASEGASVVLCGRSAEKISKAKESIIALGVSPDKILGIIGDLRLDDLHEKVIRETLDHFTKIDFLVNNAGGFGPDNVGVEGFEQSVSDFDYVIQLNLRAPLALSRLARPHLKLTKGAIVNVSSIVGKNFAAKSYPYYSISKAALDQMMRSMAVEFIDDGIRVNSINPGLTETDFFEKQGCTTEACRKAEGMFTDRPDVIPMRRVGTSEEMAQGIAFLLDNKMASYLVGHTLVVDGGASIQMPMLAGSFHDFYNKSAVNGSAKNS